MKPVVDGFPRIANMYRSVRDQLDATKKPMVTPWGFKLARNRAMARGIYERAETELVRNILKNVDVLVNVGANVGYYCCHALSMGKRVIAFEPIQRNVDYLCQNIKANNWSGSEIYPIALTNDVGVLEIYGGDTGASILKGWAGIPVNYAQLVPSSTMDVVLGNRLRGAKSLVLVDIEGAEKWMLEGSSQMLANDPKPIWVVEITTTHHQPRGVQINPNLMSTFQLFFQNGYQSFALDQHMHRVTLEHVEMALKGIESFTTDSFIFSESKVPFRLAMSCSFGSIGL